MTASNPLLRPRAPAPVLQPRFSEETIDLQLLQRAGVEFSGNLTHRIKGIVISLDWHQVCDTIRISKFQTLRCDDRGHYYLLEPLKEKLAELKDIANRVAQIGGQPENLWYCHTPIVVLSRTLCSVFYPSKAGTLIAALQRGQGLGTAENCGCYVRSAINRPRSGTQTITVRLLLSSSSKQPLPI